MKNGQQYNVDINNTTEFVCEECGNATFREALLMRKVSALLSPTGQESFVPIPVFACLACNHVPSQFMPKLQ